MSLYSLCDTLFGTTLHSLFITKADSAWDHYICLIDKIKLPGVKENAVSIHRWEPVRKNNTLKTENDSIQGLPLMHPDNKFWITNKEYDDMKIRWNQTTDRSFCPQTIFSSLKQSNMISLARYTTVNNKFSRYIRITFYFQAIIHSSSKKKTKQNKT
jgi:hypothetical protein